MQYVTLKNLCAGTVLRCPEEVTTPEDVGNITITCNRSLSSKIGSEIDVRSQSRDPAEAKGYIYVLW